MAQEGKVSSLLLFFLVSGLWCCFGCWMLAQELYNYSGTPRDGDAGQVPTPALSYDTDHPAIGEKNRPATGTGPSSFVHDVIVPIFCMINRDQPSDMSNGCYWYGVLVGKTSEGDFRTLWPVDCVECDNRYGNAFVCKGVDCEFTDGQIKIIIPLAPSNCDSLKIKPLIKSFPTTEWKIDCWDARMASLYKRRVPVVKDMPHSDESPGLNEKASSGDTDSLELMILVLVAADDGKNESLSGVYCFDGNDFVLSKTVQGQQQKCGNSNLFHGSPSMVSTMSDHLSVAPEYKP